MKQVVAYARMSTDDQCLSVGGQFAAIRIAAEANGWEIRCSVHGRRRIRQR